MIKYFFCCFLCVFNAIQVVNGQSVHVHEMPQEEAESLRQSAQRFFKNQDYARSYENYKKVANSNLASLNDIRNYADSIHRLLNGKSKEDATYLPLFEEWGEITLRAATHPQHEIQDLRNAAGVHFNLAEYTSNKRYAKTALRMRKLAMEHPNTDENDKRRYTQTKKHFLRKFGTSF